MKDYHANVAAIALGVRAFLKATFRTITVESSLVDPEKLKDSRLLIVSTHRSQADYFIVGEAINALGVHNMRFAAGDNLTNLPFIGPKFISLGAFAVKRSAKGRLYLAELCDQSAKMLLNGDSIILFPEGGRSYKGDMLEIKGGIITAGVSAQVRDSSKPVLCLPVAISYEQLPELLQFKMLTKGKELRKNKGLWNSVIGSLYYYGADVIAFAKFLVAHRIGISYGDLYLDFGRPFYLNEVADLEASMVVGARDEFSRHRTSVQTINARIYAEFMKLYRILPAHIVARLILDRGILNQTKLHSSFDEVVAMLQRNHRNVRSVTGVPTPDLVARGVKQLCKMKAIVQRHDHLQIRHRWILHYYASTVDNLESPLGADSL